MISGYIPPKGEPDPDEILAALRDALDENWRLAEMPEEICKRAGQNILKGYS